jgi:hypothetical protein
MCRAGWVDNFVATLLFSFEHKLLNPGCKAGAARAGVDNGTWKSHNRPMGIYAHLVNDRLQCCVYNIVGLFIFNQARG